MRYIIIGLGIYGTNLALDLTALGHEVVGADRNETLVDAIKDNISTAYILDATDPTSLQMLPLDNSDVVIVAIGENFGANIKIVALLKTLGVKHIYARAADSLHQSILEGFGIDRILTPEQSAASRLVEEMSLGGDVTSLNVCKGVKVMKFPAPDAFIGLKYADLNLEKDYHLRLIAVTRRQSVRNAVGITADRDTLIDVTADGNGIVTAGDTLTVFGTTDAYRALQRRLR